MRYAYAAMPTVNPLNGRCILHRHRVLQLRVRTCFVCLTEVSEGAVIEYNAQNLCAAAEPSFKGLGVARFPINLVKCPKTSAYSS